MRLTDRVMVLMLPKVSAPAPRANGNPANGQKPPAGALAPRTARSEHLNTPFAQRAASADG